MMIPKLDWRARDTFRFCLGVYLFLASCSIEAKIPVVSDHWVEDRLRSEAARIIAVSEDRGNFSKYQLLLSDFPRKDILGLSVGNGRIYISYDLALLALTDSSHLWLLRQTLAHEVGHQTAGHAEEGEGGGAFASGPDVGLPWHVRLYSYSTEKELEADLKGLGYWNKLGWDCRLWVRILEDFQKHHYTGDIFHPTDRRLQQAQRVCDSQRHESPCA